MNRVVCGVVSPVGGATHEPDEGDVEVVAGRQHVVRLDRSSKSLCHLSGKKATSPFLATGESSRSLLPVSLSPRAGNEVVGIQAKGVFATPPDDVAFRYGAVGSDVGLVVEANPLLALETGGGGSAAGHM
jgi:hypothetical protein